ncbi:MAG: hypothetical protein KKB39_04755 [Nanoarchaeota archaeon]|nr:hypothetical protein [Nanoarchaeota archaeon]
MKEKLIGMVKGKRVQICGHWDTDGVASAALMYHIVKTFALNIETMTKGKPFLIEKEDILEDTEVVICTDIAASTELLDLPIKIIYIDHHPNEDADKFHLTIHDPSKQSNTLLIYENFLQGTKDPYLIFLTLMGYFGDGGNREDIPPELHITANEVIPEMMEKRNSYFTDGYYLEIEKYVSALNTGKRLHWCGDIPLELLKCIDCYKPFVNNLHPLALELQGYKQILKDRYNQEVKIESTSRIDYIIIEDEYNVQGVIAARHIKDKPIMVMNLYQEEIIGSLRVPEDSDFDAGEFLSSFNDKIEGFIGGGHEKAGGFTLYRDTLHKFIELLKQA